MRVRLPDRPGSLGAVASAMGTVGGDIHAVEFVEKGLDYAVDDFIVDLPNDKLPETVVTACHNLPGVRVEWISRYPEGGGLQSDLEALERMTADPGNAAEILVTLCPVVFRSQWAILAQIHGDEVWTAFKTLQRFAPYDVAHRIDLEPDWIPGWADSTAVVTPLTRDRVIAIGRLGGPRFLDSEIARLHHLAALVK
jgi:hypothetical protein